MRVLISCCAIAVFSQNLAFGDLFVGSEVGVAQLAGGGTRSRPSNTVALRTALQNQMVNTGWAADASAYGNLYTATSTGATGSVPGVANHFLLGTTTSNQIDWNFGTSSLTATITRGRVINDESFTLTGAVGSGLALAGAGSNELQDQSVRPDFLAGLGAYNNITSNSTSGNVNAFVISFDKDVNAFGAWFGDLESRTDQGINATVWTLDADNNIIDSQVIAETLVESATFGMGNDGTGNGLNEVHTAAGWAGNDTIQSNFGSVTTYRGDPTDPTAADVPFSSTGRESASAASGGGFGAGNGTSRWIGFSGTLGVRTFIVSVGDDDPDAALYGIGTNTTSANGQTERLSFIGATVASAPEPSSAISLLLGLGAFCIRRRKRS